MRPFFPAQTQWNEVPIASLPFFDPELQFSSQLPKPIEQFRNFAAQSDYIVISTPEYAHGIPGILKNALEWLLCEETMKKNVVVMVGSASGGAYVQEYLLETLKTMDFTVSPQMTLSIRTAKKEINDELKKTLREFVEGFLK